MNNYSAESLTEDTREFLEKTLSKAVGHLKKKETEFQALFDDAKDYAADTTQDDERLIELLENDGQVVIWDHSEYSRWNNLPWLTKQFTPQPKDDRESHHKAAVKSAAEGARYLINNALDELETLEIFYNNMYMVALARVNGAYDYNYQTGYELTLTIINKKLPKDMQTRHDELVAFSNNIDKVSKMYESITVYEFHAVTIEENMLVTIDLVQKYMVE